MLSPLAESKSNVTTTPSTVNYGTRQSNLDLQTPKEYSPDEGGHSSQDRSVAHGPPTEPSSRRSSIEPPQTFTAESHVGPTSGVSFLYHSWDKKHDTNGIGVLHNGEDDGNSIPAAPLTSYGDIPHPRLHKPVLELQLSAEQISDICDRYFRYISPTYRFLHHPTLKSWAVSYVSTRNSRLTTAQQACVLLVCAQTLLHSSPQLGRPDIVGNGDVGMSMACSEKAKRLLENEPGPPSLTSVQARIGMCLNLLSTYRLTECRYCFSFAVTVATALGIHRRQSSTKVNPLEAECRKRTFWSLYVLDGYLSVMLGRPRLLRDDDIDQLYPQNIDDHDLVSTVRVEDLPQHGNLEAMHGHIELAKIMGQNNDRLYPLRSLRNDEILDRSNEILDALAKWQDALPEFLKPKEKTLTGQRTFERQNTILKLALAHVRILATRRCLLLVFEDNKCIFSQSDVRARRSLRECIAAIVTILDTVEALIMHGQCYHAFWTSQYIALVGISTFYVLLIQGLRHLTVGDAGIETIMELKKYTTRVQECHNHLATLPPPGSQAERHQKLLSHLRSKAERSLARWNNTNSTSVQKHSNGSSRAADRDSRSGQVLDTSRKSSDLNIINTKSSFPSENNLSTYNLPPLFDHTELPLHNVDDFSAFSTTLTPNSSADSGLNYMFDFGWESLDVIGGNSMNDQDIFQLNMIE